MRFVYHSLAGGEELEICGDSYHHIFRVCRTPRNRVLELRNLEDNKAYFYKIQDITKKSATLMLLHFEELEVKSNGVHLIWAMIEPKNIENTIPFLNELNVRKISFFYADFSQKKYRLSQERLVRILQNSCQQCGRGDLMSLEILENLKQALELYPNAIALDFVGEKMDYQQIASFKTPVCIGAEGGFSPSERELFRESNIVTFCVPSYILQSHTASVFVASLAILA